MCPKKIFVSPEFVSTLQEFCSIKNGNRPITKPKPHYYNKSYNFELFMKVNFLIFQRLWSEENF